MALAAGCSMRTWAPAHMAKSPWQRGKFSKPAPTGQQCHFPHCATATPLPNAPDLLFHRSPRMTDLASRRSRHIFSRCSSAAHSCTGSKDDTRQTHVPSRPCHLIPIPPHLVPYQAQPGQLPSISAPDLPPDLPPFELAYLMSPQPQQRSPAHNSDFPRHAVPPKSVIIQDHCP